MIKLQIFSILFIFSITLRGYSQKLTIAVSANAQYVLKELISEYKKDTPSEIDLIVGSSGKLTNQIIQGAPYHLFFSADLNFPNELFKKGLTSEAAVVYGYGSLVLITTKDINLSEGLNLIKTGKINKLALGNPETSPYGLESINVLKKAGLFQEIKSKLIFGESLSQVNHFVISGNCGLGITSKSIVMTPNIQGKIKWVEVASNLYDPIPQGVVVVKDRNNKVHSGAKRFLKFVFSDKGKVILKKNGYFLSSVR